MISKDCLSLQITDSFEDILFDISDTLWTCKKYIQRKIEDSWQIILNEVIIEC